MHSFPNSSSQITNDILSNYGGINSNSFVHISAPSNLNPDENEPIFDSLSPYFDIDSLKESTTADRLRNSFSILSLNAQSIHAKIEELRVFIHSLSKINILFDAICIQETWLDSNSDVSQLTISGYRIILHNKSASAHGGLAIYLRSDYEYSDFISIKDSELWEGLFIRIKLQSLNKSLILGNVYRPPNNLVEPTNTFFDEFSQRLSELMSNNSECVIAGDFNIDLLKSPMRPLNKDFVDLISSHGFLPKITFPTHFTDHSATLIDNFLCKLSHDYSATSAGIFTEKLSDHQAYFLSLDFLQSRRRPSHRITITKQPVNFFSCFRDELERINFSEMLTSDDPHENLALLSNALDNVMSKLTVTKTVTFNKYKHKKNPWITQGIIISIKNRDKLFRRLKRTLPNSPDHVTLKTNLATYNGIIKKMIRQAKTDYYHTSFLNANNDPKLTWKTINSVLNRGHCDDSLPTHISVSGQEFRDKQQIVDQFNQHFASIGKTL